MHRFQSMRPYSLPLTAPLPPPVLSVLHPVFVSSAVYLWEVDTLHHVWSNIFIEIIFPQGCPLSLFRQKHDYKCEATDHLQPKT